MDSTIRKATLKDLPILLEFEQGIIQAERSFDTTLKAEHITYYDLSELITSENSVVFVVEINKQIVASGYAKIKPDKPYLKHDKQGYLGFMFVSEKHRGKQLNQLIMNALLKWCQSRGAYEVKLDVYHDNIAAIKAYEKVGFKKHLINMRLNIENFDVLVPDKLS